MRPNNNKANKSGEDPVEGILPPSSKKPVDDHDIAKYSSSWCAGKKHFDYENSNRYANRFLLYGRPQLGKTGVLLHVGFLAFKQTGSPQHTSPYFEKVIVEPIEVEEDNDADVGQEVPKHCGEYPLPSHIRHLNFIKPKPSQRYGDPNNPAVMDHYKSGADFLHESVLSRGNQIYQRTELALKIPHELEAVQNSPSGAKSIIVEEKIYSKIVSKPLKADTNQSSTCITPITPHAHPNRRRHARLGTPHAPAKVISE